MSGSFLLDTNAAIAFLNGAPTVVDRFQAADEILLSSTVVGELCFGAQKSAQAAANLARIDMLIDRVVVLDVNTETARHYGQIKNALRIKGRPIPENDIWIAASALQYDLILVTGDGHFGEVDGLKLEAW